MENINYYQFKNDTQELKNALINADIDSANQIFEKKPLSKNVLTSLCEDIEETPSQKWLIEHNAFTVEMLTEFFLRAVETDNYDDFLLAISKGALSISNQSFELALLISQHQAIVKGLLLNHSFSPEQLINVIKAKIRENDKPEIVHSIIKETHIKETTIFTSFVTNPNLVLSSISLTGLNPITNAQQFGNGICFMMDNFNTVSDTDFLTSILSDSMQPKGYDSQDLDQTPDDFSINEDKQSSLTSNIFQSLDMSNARNQMLLSNVNQLAIQTNNQSVKTVTTSIINSVQNKQQINIETPKNKTIDQQPQTLQKEVQTINKQAILEPNTIVDNKNRNRNIQL